MTKASFIKAIRALIVSLGGVIVAIVWYRGSQVDQLFAAGVAIVLMITLSVLVWSGKRSLPKHPERAISLMESYLWLQIVLAALGAALIVVAAVELAAPEGTQENPTPADIKELWAALGTAVTGFITVSFISWAGEEETGVGDWIRDEFRKKYKRKPLDGKGEVIVDQTEQGVAYFSPESQGERAVYSESYGGVTGWTHDARRKRAQWIQAALDNRTDPPLIVS